MLVFGLPMELIYMYVLLASGALTILYVFFVDITEFRGSFTMLNLAVILAFFLFGSAVGFLMETATELNGWKILAVSAGTAAVLDLLLYYFILLPLSGGELSSSYSEEVLPGQVASVITPIPVDGYGEVVVEGCAGMISKRATCYDNEAIGQDEKVWIVEVNDGILYVQAGKPVSFLKK